VIRVTIAGRPPPGTLHRGREFPILKACFGASAHLQMNQSADLDYHELVKQAKRLLPGTGQSLKLALLADVSTQHLTPLLKVLFARAQVSVDIYEAGFDTVQTEAYNPASALYAFEPQVVVILQAAAGLRARYYRFSGDVGSFVQSEVDAISGVWEALQSRLPVPVLQSTFVLPYERPFGNFGMKVPGTLLSAAAEVNRELCMRARSAPSVFINDVDHVAGWVGRREFLDERLWALAKSICALNCLPLLAKNIVDIALACTGRAVKCVVLDLDNTLWGGAVGDDGLEGIGLGDLDEGGAFHAFQCYLRDLWRRGVLLAVCSKNNEAIARRVFAEHPAMVLKEEHIAVFVANWEDKASNIARIRETLNIGYDSMVFLDDNPFERNLVRQMIPQICVPELPEDPALYVRAISELNLFETSSSSALDTRRTAMYQDQAKREEERSKVGNLEDYLRSLETTVLFSRFEPQNLSRIAQLIQRSNQFNLTTRRYSESQCEAVMRDEAGFFPFSITVQDRFGDFGLVNVVILRKRPTLLEIDLFLMSCRVLQRGVEQFAMNKIFGYARQFGFDSVLGRYIPTAKNVMVKDFFQQFGFDRSAADAQGTEWRLETARYVPREIFILEKSATTQ
jgi:FkbH-like protein